MKQRIERVAFDEFSLNDLMAKLNEYTATISVGNLLDTTIETRMIRTDIKKFEGVTGDVTEVNGQFVGGNRYKHEFEEYTYRFSAVVTVLVEE